MTGDRKGIEVRVEDVRRDLLGSRARRRACCSSGADDEKKVVKKKSRKKVGRSNMFSEIR